MLDANTLTAGTAHNTRFAGSITGSSGFTKQGTGVILLNGVSPYTGATHVRGGGLVIGDATHVEAALTGGGQVTIEAGAFVGGYGSVAGDVTNHGVIAVGKLAPLAGGEGVANPAASSP